MALTNKLTKHIDLTHEPGEWIEARMPSYAILDRARQTRQKRALALMADVDLEKLRGLAGDQEREAGSEYDEQTILAACVVAWSYPEPVNAENVGELDEATAKAVLAVLLPVETEADRKNA